MREKAFKIFKRIPDGKSYVEIITAALTIPVLLTVLLMNYNNISKAQNPTPTPTPSESQKEVVYVPQKVVAGEKTSISPTITPTQAVDVKECKKDIGPVKIAFPNEGQTVDENPLSFIIDYSDDTYCSVVWSYRINGGSWSNYTTNNPIVYNIPNGNVKFDVKIQSTVTRTEQSITRNFTYKGANNPTATPSADQ